MCASSRPRPSWCATRCASRAPSAASIRSAMRARSSPIRSRWRCSAPCWAAPSASRARREIKSFWYPTWLAQAAAMVPDSKLVDSIPHGIRMPDIVKGIGDYDLAVLHTSSPSFGDDVKALRALKSANPRLKAGFVGAKVAVQPDESLKYSDAIDFVARNEFDFTIKELAEGRDWSAIDALAFRNRPGAVVH